MELDGFNQTNIAAYDSHYSLATVTPAVTLVDSATAGSLPPLEPGIVVGPMNPGPAAPAAGSTTTRATTSRRARGDECRTATYVPRSSRPETGSDLFIPGRHREPA